METKQPIYTKWEIDDVTTSSKRAILITHMQDPHIYYVDKAGVEHEIVKFLLDLEEKQ